MSHSMVKVNGLVKKYHDRVAVNGVSFHIREGEVFGLLGPNGAGKTTIISVLATLLSPDEGQITIGGYDLVRETSQVKKLIGFVPQELALYPTLSAWENLAFFGRVYGLRGKALNDRIMATLDLVGLQDRATDAVRTFSGGMKRRLNIAAGLIHQPCLLFLDEPTVGVDPQSRNFIFEHVERLKAEGMTVVYTTHYMEEAERLCDRVAIIESGEILALDTPKNLIGLLGNGVIYLGLTEAALPTTLPQIQALPHMRAVSTRDGQVKIESADMKKALLELLELCNSQNVSVRSLEVLEPNLESVFLTMEHLAIQEQQGAESLVLGGGCDVAFGGEMGEERLHLGCAHVFGMAFAVEKDEAFDLGDVGLLGADGIVLAADSVAHEVEELLPGRFWRRFGGQIH